MDGINSRVLGKAPPVQILFKSILHDFRPKMMESYISTVTWFQRKMPIHQPFRLSGNCFFKRSFARPFGWASYNCERSQTKLLKMRQPVGGHVSKWNMFCFHHCPYQTCFCWHSSYHWPVDSVNMQARSHRFLKGSAVRSVANSWSKVRLCEILFQRSDLTQMVELFEYWILM